jgi:hypothetical protein
MLRMKLLIVGLVAFAAGGISVAAASGVSSSAANVSVAQPAAVAQAQLGVARIQAQVEISGLLGSSSLATSSPQMVNFVARVYGVPARTVVNMRRQGYSFNDIANLYSFAKESGLSTRLILNMRNAGIEWNDIAQALNIGTGSSAVDLKASMSASDVITGFEASQSEETEP